MMNFHEQDRPCRRCRFIVRTADLSAWGGHRRAIGRYIGDAPINCAPTGYDQSWSLMFIIGLGSASTGHWPIHRRCANKLCAYGVLPILVGKKHYRALLLSTLAGTPGSAIL